MKLRTFAASLAIMLLSTGASAQDLSQILEQLVDTRGGAQAFEGLESYRASGSMIISSISHGGMEMVAPFTLEWQRPNRLRLDFTIQGSLGTRASDGETAWMSFGMLGTATPELLPEERRGPFEDFMDAIEGPLVRSKEKGVEVVLSGKDDLDGTDVLLLQVTRRDSRRITFVLDGESALPIELRSGRQAEGAQGEIVRTLSDYKPVSGILFPHFIETANEVGTVLQTLQIEKIEVGIELDEARFAMPTGEETVG